MKTFIFLAILIATTFCSDTPDTPGILLGNWTFYQTLVSESSECCMPTGNLTITSNSNQTITLTSTTWVGGECADRSPSYEEVINVNGADSYKQLLNASPLPIVVLTSDTTSQKIAIQIVFDKNDNNDMMTIVLTDSLAAHCASTWFKYNDDNR